MSKIIKGGISNERFRMVKRTSGSGGDPASISSGIGDSGGISYGKYQFSSNMGIVQQFVDWLQNHLSRMGSMVDNWLNTKSIVRNLKAKWRELAEVDHDGFSPAR